ncbi:class I SAM-dependent rRNA methyltransferase [Candidatus Woesearchaeota archaeon]|nr:class I SAM-dependent rRNA methyltransferase [Candidatus Woesearchaeota archaeon]
MSHYPALRLKKNEDQRLKAGHLWIFSNEVDIALTPLKGFEPGQLVGVENARGEALGLAYVNPASLISARILTRQPRAVIDQNFVVERLRQALAWREKLFSEPFYRLVYGESDGLPGVVIDRFGPVFSVQTSTAGAEHLLDRLIAALDVVFTPQAVVLRNTSALRSLEGLETYTRVALGSLPDELILRENGCRFRVDVLEGQKTGWFYDHRDNRARLAGWAAGKRVLDLFAYSGGWGIQAAVAGAARVELVDASATALSLALDNAALNGVTDRISTRAEDVFDFLKRAREERQRYDIVIADPPAFIKRRKDVQVGIEAYRRLNQAALQVLQPGGLLVSASCSFHLERATLHDLLRASARHLDRHLVLVAQAGQAADHPVHPAIPETEYLKTFFTAVERSL